MTLDQVIFGLALALLAGVVSFVAATYQERLDEGDVDHVSRRWPRQQ